MQSEQSPVNPLPPVILLGFLAMLGVEILCSLGGTGLVGGPASVGWRAQALSTLGFAPAVQDLMLSGHGDPVLLLRYVSYPLVHASFTHGAFAMALWLALGKFVGDLYRPWAVIGIVLVGVVGGAVLHGIYGTVTAQNTPLYGAYTADYALIGAYTYVIWLQLGHRGQSRLGAFGLIGVLLGLQLVFGLGFGAVTTWVAELGAFAFGGLAAILFAPGGWQAFLRRIRRRGRT